jgi:protein-lysine N-methyltransferase EEF2KMT
VSLQRNMTEQSLPDHISISQHPRTQNNTASFPKTPKLTADSTMVKQVTVIHCWSAPRSRSTALLYSFESRNDCVALDEPLYREWLQACPAGTVSRPYLNDILLAAAPEGTLEGEKFKWEREKLLFRARVDQAAKQLPDTGGVIFCKQMAKFYNVFDFTSPFDLSERGIQLIHKHLLLIRDPLAVLSSWGAAGDVHGDKATIVEVGIVPLLHIHSVLEQQGVTAAVVDSDELAADPAKALATICESSGVTFQDSM